MKDVTMRSIVRCVHLILAIPIIGYIYSPFAVIPDYAPATRFVFFPAMVLSDYGCGKAMSFDALFRTGLPDTLHSAGNCQRFLVRRRRSRTP